MAEEGQVDAGSSEGESMSNGGAQVPQKRRGRPRNPNTKPKAVEDPQTPRRGRGRPKGPGSEKRAHSQEGPEAGPPKKRGRPAAAGQEISDTPKRGRGRPSKPKPEGGKRGRGRPSKPKPKGGKEVNGGSSTPKKRGRPKGSPKKVSRGKSKSGRAVRVSQTPNKGRGRPKVPKKRGRPRKHPLPSAEELKKPKVWKPLGRPRKYPRVDPPEGATETLQRGRGRPLKVDSKRGAHLKKNTTDAGPPKKRGRPKKSIVADETEPETSEQVEGHLEEVELETVSHEEVEDTEEDN